MPAAAPAFARSLPPILQHDAAGIVRAIADDGFAFIPDLLDAALVAETCRRIDALDFPEGDSRGDGKEIDHHKCVFNRDPFWLRFLDLPGVIDAVEGFLGPRCHIIGMSAWRSPPGSGKDDPGLHLDQLFIPMDEELLTSGRVVLPVFISTLHVYLSDIDIDLCPTWVVPGSHKAGRGPGGKPMPVGHDSVIAGPDRAWNDRPEQPVLCRAGDALLFRSELWHRGSRNRTSDRWRYLLQVHYAQRGIAQRFPPYTRFQYNPDVLAAANERQARLIGKHRISAYG